MMQQLSEQMEQALAEWGKANASPHFVIRIVDGNREEYDIQFRMYFDDIDKSPVQAIFSGDEEACEMYFETIRKIETAVTQAILSDPISRSILNSVLPDITPMLDLDAVRRAVDHDLLNNSYIRALIAHVGASAI